MANNMAATRVFSIAELLDTILDHVDERTLLLSQRVNKTFKTAVETSAKFQRKLFFTADSPKGTTPLCDIRVNPLIATVQRYADESRRNSMQRIHVRLLPGFLASSASDPAGGAFRLRYPRGSSRRMHLLDPIVPIQIAIDVGGRGDFQHATLPNMPPLGTLLADEYLKWRFSVAYIYDRILGLTSQIKLGQHHIQSLLGLQAQVICARPKLNGAREGREGEILRSMGRDQWTLESFLDEQKRSATYAVDARAHSVVFSCAAETLKGRESQHFDEADEMIRKVKSEPRLLNIQDDAKRMVQWKIAMLGSA